MIKSQNQPSEDDASLNPAPESHLKSRYETDTSISNIKNFNPALPLLVRNRHIPHTPKAGLNPIVDAAGYLFSLLGKLKSLPQYRQLNTLQEELILEINTFQETAKNHGYNGEYRIVCRYILCATFDDILSNLTWGNSWDNYSLLVVFNQDRQHQDKFFSILERIIKEPAIYIDLMELMYICLSMGYKGQYRATEYSQYQLEQIMNHLYKHIRTYRGSFSKALSPTPLKQIKHTARTTAKKNVSLPFVFIVTACVIMTIFISLSYLMDIISNEAYSTIANTQPVSQKPIGS